MARTQKHKQSLFQAIALTTFLSQESSRWGVRGKGSRAGHRAGICSPGHFLIASLSKTERKFPCKPLQRLLADGFSSFPYHGLWIWGPSPGEENYSTMSFVGTLYTMGSDYTCSVNHSNNKMSPRVEVLISCNVFSTKKNRSRSWCPYAHL